MDVENCRQLIQQLLSSYVDGELDGHTSQSLELHIQICPPCAAFLRTFLATQRCCRAEVLARMSKECEASLWGFLEKECGVEAASQGEVANGCCEGAASPPRRGPAGDRES